MERHDHLVDATRYLHEAIKWRKWFDEQPFWYRWHYWAKRWLKNLFA